MKKKTRKQRGTALALVAGGVLGGIAGIHLGEGLTNGRTLQYKEVPLYSEKITPELEGYTLAFVTDIHHYPTKDIQKMVEGIQRFQPDLLLMGGDFAPKEKMWKTLELLSQIQTTDGIYGVEGNHDKAEELALAMKHYGMYLLNNQGVEIRKGLYLGGVVDFWNHCARIDHALAEAPPEDYTMLLCHDPDLTMSQDTRKADIVVCGHVHGGEIQFFGKYAPALGKWTRGYHIVTSHGQRFAKNWSTSKWGTPVFVSNGIGSHLGFRVFAPPQVIIFRLHHRKGK